MLIYCQRGISLLINLVNLISKILLNLQKGKTCQSQSWFYKTSDTWYFLKAFRNTNREVNDAVHFLTSFLALLASSWQFHKMTTVPTLRFPSVLVKMLFSEEPLLVDLFSDSFSFAIFSFSCKYSISDFCETIKVSKLDKDGCWETCFKKCLYLTLFTHAYKYLYVFILYKFKYSKKEYFISKINYKPALAKLLSSL